MRKKREESAGGLSDAPVEGPRRRMGSDLERMGVAPQLSASVARRLESSVSKLSSREYGALLGSHDYGVEDFLRTERCRDVRTLIEPMAGTAEFAYQGHFRFPDFRFRLGGGTTTSEPKSTPRPGTASRSRT